MRDNEDTAPDIIETRARAKRGQDTLNIELGLSSKQSYSSDSGASNSASASGGTAGTGGGGLVGDITVGGGGDSDGRTCFVGETPVLMGDGSKMPIGEIEPDMLVMAFDQGGELYPARVIEVKTHTTDEYCEATFADGRVTGVTWEHLYWQGGAAFREFRHIDHTLNLAAGKFIRCHIKRKKNVVIEGEIDVYNLEVETYQTYIANGDAVHNLKPLNDEGEASDNA